MDLRESASNMETQQKNIPQLRFSEFRNDGEWEAKRLGEIITVNSGRDYKLLNQGDIPVYGTGGYMLSVDDKLSDIDAIGIGRKGTIDKPQFLKAPFWTVDTLFFLTTKDGYDLNFVFFLFQTIEWKKYSEQTGVPSLTRNSIEKIEVKVPPLAEQRRIAACLSALDEVLAATNEKLEQLKAYKKGLMQKLFPAKGKNVPELRFKQFEKDGEWNVKKLGDFITVNTGRDYKHLKQGDIPVYGTGGYMLSVDDKLSDIDAIGIGRKGTIDKPQYLKAPFWTVDTLFFLTTKKGYDLNFAFFLSQTIEWRKYSEQTGVPSLTRNSIEKIEIKVPSLAEQQCIAAMLSGIEKLILATNDKHEQLKVYKKGLMQRMFPTLR